MRNIVLVLEYDGTNFFGWQRQAKGRTVQEEIEKQSEIILQEKISLTGAGRTDSGVHARGQVANFFTTSLLPVSKIQYALNGLLPEDIAITASFEVPSEFHSRYSATQRKYSYTIAKLPTALHRKFCWEYFFPLDIEAMNSAASQLIGEMDCSSFCKSDAEVEHKICSIAFAHWMEDEQFLRFQICGNRFLHGMVRAIVGTLVDVGRKAITQEDFLNIIHSRDRTKASQSAPARGLCLEKIEYATAFQLTGDGK
jgi:tRNA pseudouridine38-40 synthase